jgi:hypothetical protein
LWKARAREASFYSMVGLASVKPIPLVSDLDILVSLRS